MAVGMSCWKLLSLNQFLFEYLGCVLIIVRFGPVLILAWVRNFKKTETEKLANELYINVALHFQIELGKAKLDGEMTKSDHAGYA
jgi:hypothetical protein